MALSDQLLDLASRTKQLEDAAAAARAQDHAKLEQDREKLHSTMEAEAQQLQSSASDAQSQASSWWADTTARMEQRRAELRAKTRAGPSGSWSKQNAMPRTRWTTRLPWCRWPRIPSTPRSTR
jgi:hypothetical protein